MPAHSSILAWEIPWAEEPRGLHSMGLQRVRHTLSRLGAELELRRSAIPPSIRVRGPKVM